MPNGGAAYCGTCWFNARNKGEAGFGHARDPELSFCMIRSLAIEHHPMWTKCANHPLRRPDRDPIPIGPVYVVGGRAPYSIEVWQLSPDTEEIREHLLDMVRGVLEEPIEEYPLGVYSYEIAVWQLGEFREHRAADELRRIAAYSPEELASPAGPKRVVLVELAKEALSKLGETQG
jgi:hypothetical protein